MDKVELIGVPEVRRHKIVKVSVKPVTMSQLQIGELILFGQDMLLIENKELPEDDANTMLITALNLSHGIRSTIGYPTGTIFHSILHVNYDFVNEDGEWEGRSEWKRLRKPQLGEWTICGACGGEVEQLKQRDIDGFEAELKNEPTQCVGLAKTYDVLMDVFLSYDGCESR